MPAISFTGNYNQNFDSLATAGATTATGVAWSNGSTLEGWYLFNQSAGGTALASYAAGIGNSTTGSFYSFGAASAADRALGGLGSGGAYFGSPASGAIAGWIALAATNATGQSLTQFTLGFNGEQWRNGGNATAQSMVLEYGFGSDFSTVANWTAPGGNFDWASPVASTTAAAVDGNSAGLVNARGGTVTGVNWAAGATLWIRWVERNDIGNDHGLAIDNLSLSAMVGATNPVNLSVSTQNAAEAGATVVTVTATAAQAVAANETVTLSVGGGVSAGDYTLSASTITIPAGQTSGSVTFTVVDDADVEGAELATLTISNPSSGIVLGTTVEQTITIADNDVAAVKIHHVQGNGAASPLVNQIVTIEAIVVGDYQGSGGLSGFFVQEEDLDADADPATSEGLFISQGAAGTAVSVGDKVRVTGKVIEFASGTSSLTELTDIASVVVLSSGNPLPASTALAFPLAGSLESLEGMRVGVTTPLTVTGTSTLGRFGEVLLSSDGPGNQPGTDARLDIYTQFNDPGAAGYAAYQSQIAARRIMLDDAQSGSFRDPVVYGRGGNPLSAANTLRGGDTVATLSGIVDDRFGSADTGNYRIQPTAPVQFDAGNAREEAPAVGGSLRVASFNVLNYFNGNGTGGGFPTSRGADSLAEFNRQQSKIVAAIQGLNADIVGLVEIENDGYGPTSAIASLVDALNAASAPGTYAFVNPGAADMGSDEIAVGFIYKPASVTPQGVAATLTSAFVDPDGGGGFNSSVQRPSLAQTFEVNASGARFTPVINHFKSKGTSANGPGDADAGDGQGLSNGTRTRAADTLMDWLATDPTGSGDADFLILGDLNAYAQEDPLKAIRRGADNQAGTGDDFTSLEAASSYSYSFAGQTGSLDHALASGNLLAQVSGAAVWHINADEPEALDYNVELKSPGQQSGLFNADAFRASDHDPVVVGLDLGKTLTGTLGRDQLIGTSGNDRIAGGPGRDLIVTGGGADRIMIGGLIDFFDAVVDFQSGVDKFDISALLRSVGYAGSNPVADGYLSVVGLGVPLPFGGAAVMGTLLLFDADGAGAAEVPRLMAQVVGVATEADFILTAGGGL